MYHQVLTAWYAHPKGDIAPCDWLWQRGANHKLQYVALLVRSRMPRFSMGGGSPKAAACPTSSATVVSLRDLVARTHPPVSSISTKGRLVYLFGTSHKYPCQKFILAGETRDEDDSDGVRVLCKLNHPAPIAVKLDDMLAIGGAECRLTWKRNGVAPESVVAGKVADVELALNFGGGKRKRGGVECLGGKFGLNKCILELQDRKDSFVLLHSGRFG